jgi:condensin complex subunit 2
MPAPFESQFFNDDATDVGDYADVDQALAMDDATVMGDEAPSSADIAAAGSMVEDEDDLWAGTQGITLKRARPENVNFAKRAKRIDVKRLKDDIWGGLKGLVEEKVSPNTSHYLMLRDVTRMSC